VLLAVPALLVMPALLAVPALLAAPARLAARRAFAEGFVVLLFLPRHPHPRPVPKRNGRVEWGSSIELG
jgi:hypothetical protein